MKQTLSLVLDPHAKLFHFVNKSGGVYDLTKKAMSGSNDGYVREACGRHVGGERRGMTWAREARKREARKREG